jgi:hypothetical protein
MKSITSHIIFLPFSSGLFSVHLHRVQLASIEINKTNFIMDYETYDLMSDSESMGDESYFSDQENVQATSKNVGKKNGAKTTKTKNTVGPTKVLANKSNLTNTAPTTNVDKTKKNKTVEETYQKKTQLEHILLRPDTYSK